MENNLACNGGGLLPPRLSLSSEFTLPTAVIHTGRITEIEEEMGRLRDAGIIDAGTVQQVQLIKACNDD